MGEVEQVGVRDLRANLSRYLRHVAGGGRVVVMQRGKPVAELNAPEPRKACRKPGTLKGEIWMAADFDAWPPEVDESFEAALR